MPKRIPQPPAIVVQDLAKTYIRRGRDPVQALKGISFTVPRGSIFGLLGPNGAGKTTTIKILTTLLSPTSGSASVLGHDVLAEPAEVRRSLCAVMQENSVELFLSVRNNFRVFGRFHGMTTQESSAAAERVSELFGLGDLWTKKGMDLSGGQKRRVQVAKMFMVDKPVIVLDEATTGMDAYNKRATVAAIKKEASRGRTVILTTHMLDEAEELCDSVAIINHGTLIASGSMREVKSFGLRLITIPLTFNRVTRPIRQAFERLKPYRLETVNDLLIVTVRSESDVYRVLARAKRMRGLRHFEVYAASLEDVFLELVDKKEEA